MREVNEPQADDLGTLGQVIRPQAPAQPDHIKAFEHLADTNAALESIAETLRRKAAPVITDGQESDWEGICMDEYVAALMGCI